MVGRLRVCAALLVILLAFTAARAEELGPPPPDFPKFVPAPLEAKGQIGNVPSKVALVLPDARKVTPYLVTTALAKPRTGHYIVTEWCTGNKTVDASVSGPMPVAEGQGSLGPNCYAQASVSSGTVFNFYSVASIGPLSVTNPITVEWSPGPNGDPEPAKGLTLYLHHDCRAYTEAQGLGGVGKVLGSSKAKSYARTRGPKETCEAKSESNAPLCGADADPQGNSKVEVLTGLKSGWKGFISAQTSAVAGSWIVGCARAETTAEITWEASCTAAVEEDMRKSGRERSAR